MWMQVREMMAAQTQMNKNVGGLLLIRSVVFLNPVSQTHQIVALSAVPQLLPSGPFSNFSMMAPTPLDYWSAALQTPFYNQNVVPGNAFSQPWNLTPFPFYEQAQPNNRLKRAPGHMSR
jgi:hypothetical protein